MNVEVPTKIEASKINECAFPNKVKPGRVDNTCKAALDDVALRLQREADAKAVIVGEADQAAKIPRVALLFLGRDADQPDLWEGLHVEKERIERRHEASVLIAEDDDE